MEISVIIPVCNAEEYVEQAVESALSQPETAEVVLLEEGSTDKSLQICERLSYEHDRIRLLQHDNGTNRGIAASRNLGILNTLFPYIAFLDADDYYLPGRFTEDSKVFEQHPEAEGVYDAVGVLFESESARKSLESCPLFPKHFRIVTIRRRLAPDRLLDAFVTGDNGRFHTNGIVVKKSLFEKVGLFDECLSPHEDTAMWMKMAAVGTLLPGCIERPVAIYRIHGNNTILRVTSGYDPMAKKLADLLCEWGRSHDLPSRKMQLLLYHRWLSSLFDHDPGLRQRFYTIKIQGPACCRLPRILWFLTSRFARHPSLVFSRHFLYLILLQISKVFKSGAKNDQVCQTNRPTP
jgi:glycosyltransferase involved in cell wall biosynthesis